MPPHFALYLSVSVVIGVSSRNRHGSPHFAASIFGDKAVAAADPAAEPDPAPAAEPEPALAATALLPAAGAGWLESLPLPHANAATITITPRSFIARHYRRAQPPATND